MRTPTVLLALVLCFSGCAGMQTPQQRHPANPVTGDSGSTTAVDADAYDILLVAHSVIEDTKAQLNGDGIPPKIVDAVRAQLPKAVEAYNALNKLYREYHKAPTAAAEAELRAKTNELTAASAALTKAKAGQP